MTTINEVAKKVVAAAIDMDYVTECGHTTVAQVYNSEYGWAGLTPTTCKNYLQGLPSVCEVPYWNNEILDLLSVNGITRKTEDGNSKLIEDYWYACGNQLYLIVKSGK